MTKTLCKLKYFKEKQYRPDVDKKLYDHLLEFLGKFFIVRLLPCVITRDAMFIGKYFVIRNRYFLQRIWWPKKVVLKLLKYYTREESFCLYYRDNFSFISKISEFSEAYRSHKKICVVGSRKFQICHVYIHASRTRQIHILILIVNLYFQTNFWSSINISSNIILRNDNSKLTYSPILIRLKSTSIAAKYRTSENERYDLHSD